MDAETGIIFRVLHRHVDMFQYKYTHNMYAVFLIIWGSPEGILARETPVHVLHN